MTLYVLLLLLLFDLPACLPAWHPQIQERQTSICKDLFIPVTYFEKTEFEYKASMWLSFSWGELSWDRE